MTTALYRIIFSYGGYNNAFNVVNEVKVGKLMILFASSKANFCCNRTLFGL